MKLINRHQRTSPTMPFAPNRPKTPFFNFNIPSISPRLKPCRSRIVNACLIVHASTNSRPANPGRPICSASSCAAFAAVCRAVSTKSAGFAAVGKTGWFWFCCWVGPGLNVLVRERVGLGTTGPMERRDAAKSGSRPSRSITVDFVVEACSFGIDGACD